MNLENDYQALINALFNGEKAIGIFVLKNKYHYVVDDKENFCIDVRSDYQNYIKQGIMEQSLYDEALKQYRGGIPVLTENNFQNYLDNTQARVYSLEWLYKFFISGHSLEEINNFYQYIEDFLTISNAPVSNEWDKWRLKLPTFYINFNKKIFRHTDWEHEYDFLVPNDWEVRLDSNFGLLVPDSEQYWIINGMNFWKLKM